MTILIVLSIILPSYYLSKWTKMPPLIFYLLFGIIFGPYGLDYLTFTNHDLIRQLALVVIMLRSGLGLSVKSLLKVKKEGILLSFLPGLFDASIVSVLSVLLLDFTFIQGYILGFMLAAVSPAVVVPAMLKLIDKNIGGSIPTMILASSALDDVIALSFFSFFINLFFNQSTSLLLSLLIIPLNLIFSFAIGYGFVYIIKNLKKFNIILIIIMALLANYFEDILPISALILIMAMGLSLSENDQDSARILIKYSKYAWDVLSVFLFVLVGSILDIFALVSIYKLGLIIIIIGLAFRSLGVIIAVSDLSFKEKIFSIFAFMPKATVQAALASVPLSMGVVGGDKMLLLAILSILVTTPLGATLLNITPAYLLNDK